MTIVDIITQMLLAIAELVISPIDTVLEHIGYGGMLLGDYNIKVGFGSVEWFSFNLHDLIIIILGLALAFILLRLIYRFIKWLFRLGKGLVGIR